MASSVITLLLRKAAQPTCRHVCTVQVGQAICSEQLLCERQADILRLTSGDTTTKFAAKQVGLASLSSSTLKDRKILLVLDDLWEEDHLKWLIPELGQGSRLLVTTRNEALVSRKTHTGCVLW